LRAGYESTHLSNVYSEDSATLRSSLSRADLAAIARRIAQNQTRFAQLMGDDFAAPVSGDPNPTLTLFIFGSQAEYREYVGAFVGSGSDAGGIYVEQEGTLYTYQRSASTSAFTMEHLIDHEQTHYLLGRSVFPGMWTDPQFHSEPRGWADEGMAEFLAENWRPSDPRKPEHLVTICRSGPRSLSPLLQLRAGYDQAGTFDYDNAWAFVTYLMSLQPAAGLRLYGAMRNQAYPLQDFPSIFGARSLEDIDSGWQKSIREWCGGGRKPEARIGAFASGFWLLASSFLFNDCLHCFVRWLQSPLD
jgi:collagenase